MFRVTTAKSEHTHFNAWMGERNKHTLTDSRHNTPVMIDLR